MKFFFYGLKEDVDEVKKYFNQNDIVDIINNTDIVVIVGGDGALLNEYIKEQLIRTKKPTLKIHHRHNSYKSLGFTMDVNLKNLETALKDIDDGKYFIQTVRLIEVDINGLIYYALNDVANCSAIPNSTLITKVIINGKIVMPTPKCTGIIISTSYGSSSWILSSNGAVIVEDDYECLCLAYRESSLKPHNFIISENSTIKISSKRDMMLAVDGENIPVFAETPISVCLSGANINMLRTTNTYEGIIQKLNRLTKFQYDQVNF